MPQFTNLEIRPPRPEEDAAFDYALGGSLHFPGGLAGWMERLGRDSFLTVLRHGRIVAGAALAPAGIWLGSARIPLVLVNGVGVAPDARGSGVGLALMRAALEWTRDHGAPLAALYPATLGFYRRAGFERAGSRITYELPVSELGVSERSLELEPFGSERFAEARRLYEQRARQSAGNLARPDWMWQMRLDPPGLAQGHLLQRFFATRGGRPEGYVVVAQGTRNDPLIVHDVCALTPAAGRRILTLFGDYRTMVEHVRWHSGPFDQLLYLMPENLIGGIRTRHRIVYHFEWMLRVVDVAAALQARGYPPGISAELHLDVRDESGLIESGGRHVLRVADGRAMVERGGAGRIKLDVRQLAALYTGFMAPSELGALGELDALEADLALLGALFSGPRPWVPDMF